MRTFLKPAVVVLLVAPFLGEVLSTSLQPVYLLLPWNLALLAALYGCGALLCREVARRFGLGRPGLILLAAAYGVYEEALIVGTWFDAGYQEEVGVGSYSRVWETNVLLAGHLTTFHVAVSICASVLIVERMFPAHRRRPWAGRRGLAVAAVALFVVVPFGYGGAYRGPVPQMVAAGVLGAALVTGAFVVRRRVPLAVKPSRLTATVAFLCTGAHFVTVYAVAATDLPWPVGAALAFAPVVVGVLVLRRTAAGLRVVVGILAFFVLLDAVVGLGGRYDLTVAAVGLAVVLWRLLRRDNGAVFDFVRHPPELVGDLAAALGTPVDDLAADGRFGWGSARAAAAGLSVTYRWDVFHDRPVASAEELARRRLERYSVRFADGRAACAAQLRAAYGPPVEIDGQHRYGPFLVAGTGAPFTLEWFATIPDRALPPVDAGARIRALQRIAAGADPAAVPDGLGITVAGTGLTFRPPMPVADVARAFGWEETVGQTVDVHMSVWVVVLRDGDRTARPHLGKWRVMAYLDGRASGAPIPDVPAPAALVAALGPDDTVRSVSFTDP